MRNLILLIGILYLGRAVSVQSIDNKRFEILSGRKNEVSTKSVWDQKFSNEKYIFGKKPAETLKNYLKLIGDNNNRTVLDIAMGEGRNAVFMALNGYRVTGIDISSVAIKKANALARENNVSIKGIVADLDKYEFKNHEFDIVLCYYYLDRDLIAKMKKWLKPGGIIIFEGYTIDDPVESKGNKNYLLENNELLKLFSEYRVVHFEEPLNNRRFYSSFMGIKPQN